MIGPYCIPSRFFAFFVLYTTLPGILKAKIHRCLREFDPSNCNALEEVWAFDVEGKKCIEVVYGGCGAPKYLSNRFESQEECMQNCGKLVSDPPSSSTQKEVTTMDTREVSGSSDKPHVLLLGRGAPDTAPGTGEAGTVTVNNTVLENIRNVLNDLGQELDKDPLSDTVKEQRREAQYTGSSPTLTAGGIQSIYEDIQGRPVNAHLPGVQPPYGTVIGPHIGQQLSVGSGLRPLPYEQTYERQPQVQGGQLQWYGVPQYTGTYQQTPVYHPPSRSFYGQGLMENNQQVQPYVVQPLYRMAPSPIEAYAKVQNMPIGVPYWQANTSM